MTDPSACKTTIALTSGGGRAASGHPGLQAPPLLPIGLPLPGSGVPWGRGRETGAGQRSPVSHDEVRGLAFTSGGPGCEGCPTECPPQASAPLPSRNPHCLGPYLSSPPGARLGGWRLRVWPLLSYLSLGVGEGGSKCGRGGAQAAGSSSAFGSCAAGGLNSCNPRDPIPTLEKPGAEE